jgi:phospholipase C
MLVLGVGGEGQARSTRATPSVHSGLSLGRYEHIVVIYEENHSFDNLFGGWKGVRGRPRHPRPQVDSHGVPLKCLPQNDVNLTSPPVAVRCSIELPDGTTRSSGFGPSPFAITRYIPASARTCQRRDVAEGPSTGIRDGDGVPGGCTRDLVHNFYQEQYQIHGGRMDRYVTGSTALGLTMGYYDTRDLPLYRYLHAPGAPPYAIEDRFFHAAFGGSYLSHQWLIAARTPTWPGADATGGPDDLHARVGADGYPAGTDLHPAAPGTKDGKLTQAAAPDGTCAVAPGSPNPPAATLCGDYAVNTIQPPYQPYAPGTAEAQRLPAQAAPTIGDRLSDRGIDWAWYAGGWDDANGNVKGPGWTNGPGPTCSNHAAHPMAKYPLCPDAAFQFHHQAFNYYARYAPGTAARAAHLRDEVEFIRAAKSGDLRPVSFVKPNGRENQHPGYASQDAGDRHLVALLKALFGGPAADDTLVIVSYDEFGGQWDHVAPPTPGRGLADRWGPGTRIPTVVLSRGLKHPFIVDRTPHDTTAILAEIEHRFGLLPVATRDAAATDFSGDVITRTSLSAAPAARFDGRLSATLTRAASATPVANQRVVFSVSAFGVRRTVCSARTGDDGVAACTASIAVLSLLLSNSYRADFAGAGEYLATSATAALR